MGVNTDTYLPGSTGLDDVAAAIQRLTDADEIRIKPVGGDISDGIIVARRGQDYVSNEWFDLQIQRADGFGDGETVHNGSIHLCATHHGEAPGDDKGTYGPVLVGNGINVHGGNASAFWAALGSALVEFFGGVCDFNDCDSQYADVSKRPTARSRVRDGDDQWTRQKKALAELTTVTDEVGLAKFDDVPGLYNRHGLYVSEDGTYS